MDGSVPGRFITVSLCRNARAQNTYPQPIELKATKNITQEEDKRQEACVETTKLLKGLGFRGLEFMGLGVSSLVFGPLQAQQDHSKTAHDFGRPYYRSSNSRNTP